MSVERASPGTLPKRRKPYPTSAITAVIGLEPYRAAMAAASRREQRVSMEIYTTRPHDPQRYHGVPSPSIRHAVTNGPGPTVPRVGYVYHVKGTCMYSYRPQGIHMHMALAPNPCTCPGTAPPNPNASTRVTCKIGYSPSWSDMRQYRQGHKPKGLISCACHCCAQKCTCAAAGQALKHCQSPSHRSQQAHAECC